MTDQNPQITQVFQDYLDFRFQKAGALTIGQKLDLVRALMEEARQGNVPTGPRSVARLPVDHPAVQATLRGEEISLGAATIRQQADWKDVSAWPMPRKLMLLGGIVLVMILLGAGMMRGKAAAATPTPTPSPTEFVPPTPDWPVTLTAVALEYQQREPTQPPPPPPTPTPAFQLGKGGPAESSRDPASIEIAGRLFMVAQGKVDDQGQWQPQGPEWLAGTEVRRVFAIPYQSLSDAQVNAGDPIYVRTRSAQVITYHVRDVIHLLANQIETLVSLRPSLVVALPMEDGDVNSVERILILGEAEDTARALISEETVSTASQMQPNAVALGGINLRDKPGLSESQVIIGLQPGTPLLVMQSPPVMLDGHVWVYVLSPYGYGWVAKDMILIN